MKKVIGIIFLVLAAFLTLVQIAQIPKLVSVVVGGMNGNVHDVAYMVGTLIAFGFFVACIYFFIRFGLKWVRKPQRTKPNVLDEDLMQDV
jgi:hypothetical protein